jgi:hypothetical protein
MTTQLRRGFLWVALFALLVCTAYGVVHHELFQQDIWTHTGLKRFAIFTLGYGLFCAAFSLWKPGLFPAVVGALAVIYTVASTGALALLTVAVVLLSSLVLGQSILGRGQAFSTDSAAGSILAMLLGLSVYVFVLSIAAHAPINYALTYLLVLAIPLIWNWRATAAWLARIPALKTPLRLSRTEQFGCAALIFVLLSHWLVALQPEVGPDALAMHLAIPASVAWSHQWSFDVAQHLWAVMPMGADWCFTLCYLLGGEAAARLFNFALLLCIVFLLLSAIRKWLPLAPALLMAALFAATPLVQLLAGSLYVENLWSLLCIGALISIDLYRSRDDPRYLYLAFVLLGTAVATKFGALAFLPPLALISFWPMRKKRVLLARFGQAAGAIYCLAAFAAPPYISAVFKTGSPVFPYLATAFPSFYPALAAGLGTPPPGSHLALTSPFDLTFHTSLFREVQDGAVGFQYFLFLPLCVFLLRRNWPTLAVASGVSLVLFSTLALAVEPTARYLYPALPLATLFIAAGFAALERIDRPLYGFAIALAVAVFFLDLYFLPSSGWMHKDFVSNPASSRARFDYVTAYAPERNLIQYLNRAHPGAPAAFFESNADAELGAPAFTTSWHTVEFNNRVSAAASPAECLRVLQDYGVHFVLAPQPNSGIRITTTAEETFLKQCTEPESVSGKFYAGRVKENCAAAEQVVVPLGEYDDFDTRIQFHGVWSRGRFPEASHGTVTWSDAAGADLTLKFSGSEVIYVYTKAFNRGIAEILLDGASQGTVDLYSPSIEWQTATPFRTSEPGPHTLQIRVTGRKDSAATGAFVDLDALIVR